MTRTDLDQLRAALEADLREAERQAEREDAPQLRRVFDRGQALGLLRALELLERRGLRLV